MLGCCLSTTLSAQDEVQGTTDSIKTKRLEILNTDLFEFSTIDSNTVRDFTGNVHFRHEGTDFFSEVASQYMEDEYIIAIGDILIEKPDSFTIIADQLTYYIDRKYAEFRGNVIFEDSTARMLTDSLDYDLNTNIGQFWGGGTLVNDSSVLSSLSGTYYHRKREAIFKGDVHLENPDFDLYSDSMRYDTEEKIAYFIAATRIVNGDDVITTNSGYYDTKTNKAQFGGNTEMVSGSTTIRANELDYDSEAGFGIATGNVIWQDSVEEITILANYAEYIDSIDYVLATEDPLLIDITDGDTLYMSADTLVTFKIPPPIETGELADLQDTLIRNDSSTTDSALTVVSDTTTEVAPMVTDSLNIGLADSVDTLDFLTTDSLEQDVSSDSIRIFYAYRQVRFLSGSLAGVCDSLYFSHADSTFRMHYDPIMWVDTTQFTGDSLHMVLRNKTLDRIYIYQNSMIIHENQPGIYDQSSGKLVTGIFTDEDLDEIRIEGNGQSIYFIQDDSSALVGGNRTLCSRMIITMEDTTDQVKHITFLTQPEATFTPFRLININSYYLDGFQWYIERRPWDVKHIVRYWPLYLDFLQYEREKRGEIAEEQKETDDVEKVDEVEIKDQLEPAGSME